jgi:hypothetical protein
MWKYPGPRPQMSWMTTVIPVVLIFAAGACGSDSPTEPTLDVENNLVFTRSDGSPVGFLDQAQLYVWCGPWDGDVVPAPSLQVWFGGPGVSDPKWHLKAVVAGISAGTPVLFPHSVNWDDPDGVELFVLDPPNELSTTIDGAGLGGQITFQVFQCGAEGVVHFSINTVIGSELGDGPPVTVSGSFRAPVGQPPF